MACYRSKTAIHFKMSKQKVIKLAFSIVYGIIQSNKTLTQADTHALAERSDCRATSKRLSEFRMRNK
jgi:hypothetical protein